MPKTPHPKPLTPAQKAARFKRDRKERTLRNVRKHRAQLIEQLGGKCIDCSETDPSKLQFDHKNERTWVARKSNRWVRMSRYKQEAAAGNIELRCGSCNKRKGKPKPGTTSKKAEVYEEDW